MVVDRLQVDIYHLPSQTRLHTVQSAEKTEKSGMVMSLALFHMGASLTLVTAYENGLASVVQQDESGAWDLLYRAQSHSQPVLSLDVSPNRDYFLTSGADAVVVKHPIPNVISSTGATSPPAQPSGTAPVPTPGSSKSLLSAALAAEPHSPKAAQNKNRATEVQTQPMKIINTKHSGQQGLRIRSDGKIYATAGWDSKVRVYSAQTMRELAVLKWHQVGCYTVAFASLDSLETVTTTGVEGEGSEIEKENGTEDDSTVSVVPKLVDVTVRDRRIKEAKETHWLAAGSKDGKISLWDIY
jgi:WD40 repeat protein